MSAPTAPEQTDDDERGEAVKSQTVEDSAETARRASAAREVALDVANAVRMYEVRAQESDQAVQQYEESARRERETADMYRRKAVVLRKHCDDLGIDVGVLAG